ncbi:hypothetical protein FIBSPDRAFT_873038, partial [Athelia psychrophila]
GGKLGDGLGDVECLVCTLDPQLRFSDRDAQEQSYGFGLGKIMSAASVVTSQVKHDPKDRRDIAPIKLNSTSGSKEP